MNSRYLSQQELLLIFEKNILPVDISQGYVIGVTEVCALAIILEDKKIEGVHEDKITSCFGNIKTVLESGYIWILELNAENLSHLLINDGFYKEHCNKKENPLTLSKRISLFYDDTYSYWTDNVYEEAFEL